MIISILFFSALFLGAASTAHAYIDPGTGSMLLQVLIGSVVGAFVVGRKFFVLKLKQLFSFGKNKNQEKSDVPAENKPEDNNQA